VDLFGEHRKQSSRALDRGLDLLEVVLLLELLAPQVHQRHRRLHEHVGHRQAAHLLLERLAKLFLRGFLRTHVVTPCAA
jgi:hypothetical protein